MQNGITFVYLDLERSDRHSRASPIFLELKYSIATLLAEIDGNAAVVVYTNRPDRYSRFPVQVEDISDAVPEFLGDHGYIYRAKPAVLLDALRKRQGICVFLDSDTYILPGFLAAISERAKTSAIMHEVFWDQMSAYHRSVAKPFPGRVHHTSSPLRHFWGNSGVIGLRSGFGERILEDALHIIDELLPTKLWNRTLEQHAIAEAIWLHGISVEEIHPWIVHYCSNSRKRYMHFQIKRLTNTQFGDMQPTRPCIVFNPHRVKLFQYYHDVNTFIKSVKQLTATKVKPT
jgi:hypothetical protein